MNYRRQTWQHRFENRSESQLKDTFYSIGWIVERLRHDYGEDLFARPFENGNPTGHDFFIQLKGTDDVEQYRLTNGKFFSYPIDLVNLVQWYSYSLPVILIIWDITARIGYWAHVQPTIEEKLKLNPRWLDNSSGAEKPTRKVKIRSDHLIEEYNLDSLKPVIETEWRKIQRGKQHFEILYQAQTKNLGNEYNPDLPLAIEQQLHVIELKAILAANPDQFKRWLDLASIYYDIHDLAEALKSINRAWELNPENKNIQQVRACILAEYARRNGNPPSMLYEAISLFQTTSTKSDNAVSNYNVGNCYSALDQHEKAIEYFDKALSANPDPPQVARIWTNRGNSADYIGKRDEAIYAFKKAIELDAELWNAHASWAALEVRCENFEEACHHFRNALQYNPELETSGDNLMYWYAESLFHIKNYREALRIVDQLLMVHPVHKEAILLKTHILYHLRRIDKGFSQDALVFFQERLLDDPTNILARSELNFIYLEQGRIDERRRLLEETIALEDPPAMALCDYAVLLEDEGEIDKAIYYFQQAVEKEHNHRSVHALARLYQETSQYEKAICYYNLALEDVTDPLPILEQLTDCHYFLNDYRSCVVVISRALRHGTSNLSWWDNLYFALNKLGVEPPKFTSYLSRKIYDAADLSEDEIRAKLDEITV